MSDDDDCDGQRLTLYAERPIRRPIALPDRKAQTDTLKARGIISYSLLCSLVRLSGSAV